MIEECERAAVTATAPNLSDFDLLTYADAAQLLQCSKAHVSNLVAGKVRDCPPIPSVRLGRRRLIRRGSLLLWIEQNERATIQASPERGRRDA
jgi:excisionase family DNA binding protein